MTTEYLLTLLGYTHDLRGSLNNGPKKTWKTLFDLPSNSVCYSAFRDRRRKTCVAATEALVGDPPRPRTAEFTDLRFPVKRDLGESSRDLGPSRYLGPAVGDEPSGFNGGAHSGRFGWTGQVKVSGWFPTTRIAGGGGRVANALPAEYSRVRCRPVRSARANISCPRAFVGSAVRPFRTLMVRRIRIRGWDG